VKKKQNGGQKTFIPYFYLNFLLYKYPESAKKRLTQKSGKFPPNSVDSHSHPLLL
jgi:hypothetical protein